MPRGVWKRGTLSSAGPEEAPLEQPVAETRSVGDLAERQSERDWFRNYRLRKFASALSRVLEVALIVQQRSSLAKWIDFDTGSVLTNEVGELLRSP